MADHGPWRRALVRGDTADFLVREAELGLSRQLQQKPFTVTELANAVRDAIPSLRGEGAVLNRHAL